MKGVSMDQQAVIKIAGAEPEQFMIAWMAWMDSSLPTGAFMRTTRGMSEREMRSELEKMQIQKKEIDNLIQTARENPK
jgi:hypothetical protein